MIVHRFEPMVNIPYEAELVAAAALVVPFDSANTNQRTASMTFSMTMSNASITQCRHRSSVCSPMSLKIPALAVFQYAVWDHYH